MTFWTGWGIFRWTGHTKNFRPEFLQRHFGRAAEYSIGQDLQIILDQIFFQRHFGRAAEYSVGEDLQIILDQNFSNHILDGLGNIPLDRIYIKF